MLKVLFKPHFNWQSFKAKPPVMATHDCHYYTWLGHLGQCDTNRNDPISVVLTKVAKASKAGNIVTWYHQCFCQQMLPVYMNLYTQTSFFYIDPWQEQRCFYSPSAISFSLISQAKIVGFSRLYDSIFPTTSGVATFGFEPPIMPGCRPPLTKLLR